MTRRISTAAPEPPVMFYKIVALSFVVITVVLLGVVIFMTSKKATIIVVSKEDSVPTNFEARVVSGKSAPGETVSGVVTSTIFEWAKQYSPQGTKLVTGTAQGEVTVYNKSNTAITLIPKTRFITSEGVLFRLTSYTNVPAHGQVTTAVYADKPGREGEIPPSQFTLPGLPEDRQTQVYAVSAKPMVGGATQIGVLTQDDLTQAEKDFKEQVKEEFLSKNSAFVSPATKVVVAVDDSNIRSSQGVGGEVKDFTLSGTTTLVVVYYNTDELAQLVQKEVIKKTNSQVEKILPASKEPKVSLASYDLVQGTARLAITQDLRVTIDANSDKIAPQNFLGMKKNEIEKYVLELDHVAGVDVRFTPSWMKSAPEVGDKIKVIVRNVK